MSVESVGVVPSQELGLSEEEKEALLKVYLPDDVTDSISTLEKKVSRVQKEEKKAEFVGPPIPVHRDGMGKYIVPPGGKPLSSYDAPAPGPADYFADDTTMATHYPEFTFGEKIEKRRKKGNPAPNKYSCQGNLKWGKCKRITIKSKNLPPSPRLIGPGPGYYGLDRDIFTGPKYSVRLKPAHPNMPGLTSTLALRPDPRLPGPDFNTSNEEWLQKPQTFGIKHKDQFKSYGPGPQAYKPVEKKKGPKWSCATVRSVKKPEASPGPGEYELKSSIGRGPKAPFGLKIQPFKQRFPHPGPETYHRAGFRLDEPGYTMKYRWFDPKPARAPGPAKYTLKSDMVKERPPAYSIKNMTKATYPFCTIQPPGPGPAQYNIGDDKPKGKTFGIKHLEGLYTEAPGPADYQEERCPKACFREAPAYSMAPKFVKKVDPDAPGPLTYDVNYPTTAVGKTIGVKIKTKSHTYGPGPTYDPPYPGSACKPCQNALGATVKGRHTPLKYLGLKNNLPPQPKNFPAVPLLQDLN